MPSAPTTMAVAWPLASRLTAGCGIRIALGAVPWFSVARTYIPGINTPFGFGKLARRPTEPVPGSTVTSEKASLPVSG